MCFLFKITAILLLTLVLNLSISSAEILFQDDFDNPTPADWECGDGPYGSWKGVTGSAYSPCNIGEDRNGATTVSGTIESPGRDGSGNSFRMNRCDGYDNGYTGALYYDPTDHTYPIRKVYYRVYKKIPVGWDFTVSNECKLSRYYIKSTNTGVAVTAPQDQIRVSWYGINASDCQLRVGSYLGDFFSVDPGGAWRNFPTNVYLRDYDDGEWHCWEFMLDIQTTQVVLELWIDGVSRGQIIETTTWDSGRYPNLTIRELGGFGWGNLTTGTWGSFPTADAYSTEYDDFVVGTEYIGPDGKNLPQDNEAPSKPSSLQEIDVLSTQVNIEWNASTDNVGVTEYNIYRNGSEIGSSGSPSYSDNIVMPNTTYSYSVSALDAAANESDLSDAIQVATPESSYNSILFETWENNNINNWDDDLVVGDTHIDTSPVYAGNYAIKMESSNAGNYAHFFGDHPGVDGDMITDVTLEEHYYLSPGFRWPSSDMKLWIMNCFEAWGAGYNLAEGQSKPHTWAPYYMTISVNGNGQPFGQLTRADGLGGTGDLWHNYQQNEGSPVALNPGSWNKIKFRLKLNSLGNSDGIFQLWVNDELKCNYFNLNYRGTYDNLGWNHLMMSMHANPSHPQSQWISRDNIHIFSGAEPAPSAPSAPSSLRIISE